MTFHRIILQHRSSGEASSLGSQSVKLEASIPTTCVICGNSDAEQIFTLRSSVYKKLIEIRACQQHPPLKEILKIKPFPLIAVGFLCLTVYLQFFLVIHSLWGNILLAGAVLFLFLGIVPKFIHQLQMSHFLNDHVFIDSFPEGTVIGVNNERWFEKFQEINHARVMESEKARQAQKVEEREVRFRVLMRMMIVLSIFSLIGTFLSLNSSLHFSPPESAFLKVLAGVLFLVFHVFLITAAGIFFGVIRNQIYQEKHEIYFPGSK